MAISTPRFSGHETVRGYLRDGAEGTPVLPHGTCDHDMRAVVVCSHRGEPIDVREITARAAPSFAARR